MNTTTSMGAFLLQSTKYLITNIALAALFIYFINFTGIFTDFRIPINPTTMIVIGVLGIPGLILVIALKLTITNF